MSFLPTIVGSGASAYSYLQRTRATQEDVLRNTTSEALDITAVKERLNSLTSADALLEDRQVLRVVLTSFGLEGDLENRGFLRNVLNSDPNAPGSFANRLSDQRYASLARSFNFGGHGGANYPGASAKDSLSAQFQRLSRVEDLFDPGNRGLLVRALEVFGLEEDIQRPVLLINVLNSDLSDPNSTANRLGDAAYVEFAQAFQNDTTQVANVLRGKVSDSVAAELASLETPQDLLSSPRLLRATLAQFGLEDMARNTQFLEAVLSSDLNDPTSFVNTLSDKRFTELAATFDFAGRAAEKTSLYGFASLASENISSLVDADALIANEELLNTALDIFGLDRGGVDDATMKQILEADVNDQSSIVNEGIHSDYLAFSKAFAFGDRIFSPGDTTPSRVERLITAVEGRPGPAPSVDAFFEDSRLSFAALNLFDLPITTQKLSFTRLTLTSDLGDPLSAVNVTPTDGYRLLRDAAQLDAAEAGFTYPPGFADAIVNDYVSRQFELSVGNVDDDMRLLLGFERDLTAIAENATTNDARWFQILGSRSVRATIEGAFGLPSSLGQIDVTQQLGVFKERAEQIFGTSEVSDLLSANNLEEIERRYLGSVALSGGLGFSVPSQGSSILSILA